MNRVQRQIILDALDDEHLLNEWESNFINNLADLDEKSPDTPLNERQNSILNRINNKLQTGY